MLPLDNNYEQNLIRIEENEGVNKNNPSADISSWRGRKISIISLIADKCSNAINNIREKCRHIARAVNEILINMKNRLTKSAFVQADQVDFREKMIKEAQSEWEKNNKALNFVLLKEAIKINQIILADVITATIYLRPPDQPNLILSPDKEELEKELKNLQILLTHHGFILSKLLTRPADENGKIWPTSDHVADARNSLKEVLAESSGFLQKFPNYKDSKKNIYYENFVNKVEKQKKCYQYFYSEEPLADDLTVERKKLLQQNAQIGGFKDDERKARQKLNKLIEEQNAEPKEEEGFLII